MPSLLVTFVLKPLFPLESFSAEMYTAHFLMNAYREEKKARARKFKSNTNEQLTMITYEKISVLISSYFYNVLWS